MFALKKNHEKHTKNNYKLQKNHIYFLIVLIKKTKEYNKKYKQRQKTFKEK